MIEVHSHEIMVFVHCPSAISATPPNVPLLLDGSAPSELFLESVSKLARRATALLHHVNFDCLYAAYFNLKKTAAVGVDEVTWHAYEQNVEANNVRSRGCFAYRELRERNKAHSLLHVVVRGTLNISSGVQTERLGNAGPVRLLLGGETHRPNFFS